jgi:hypothetical protein
MRFLVLIVLSGVLATVTARETSRAGGLHASVPLDAAAPDPRFASRLPSGSVTGGPIGRCPDFRSGFVFYSRVVGMRLFQLGTRSRPNAVATPVGKTGVRPSCPLVRLRAITFRDRARSLRARFERWYRETYARWRCIHRHEGSWTDPNAPYYGGLQMDLAFQRAHGPEYLRRWGTADRWPVWAQLRTAERARRTRGFHPWPNTARACGLL